MKQYLDHTADVFLGDPIEGLDTAQISHWDLKPEPRLCCSQQQSAPTVFLIINWATAPTLPSTLFLIRVSHQHILIGRTRNVHSDIHSDL